MLVAFSSDHHHNPYAAFARTLNEGMNSRVAEMMAIEAYMREVMREKGVTVHFRGGDLFDRKNQIDAVVFSEISRQIAQNKAEGIEEIILKGNHDLAAGGMRNSLEALAHIGSVRIVSEFTQVRYENTLFSLVAYDDDPEKQRDGIKWAVQAAHGTHSGAHILLAHLQIRGCKSGSEYVLPGNLTTDDLCLDAWDHVFLGHVHEPQQLTPKCLYIGSMSQRSFQDEGSERRMLIYDTEAGTFESIPLPGPRFYTTEVNDPDDLAELEAVVGKQDYLKVIVSERCINVKDVDESLDGRCAGWMVTYNFAGPAAPPRIDPTLTRWEDVTQQYVDQVATDLDKARLVALGAQIRAEAADATA